VKKRFIFIASVFIAAAVLFFLFQQKETGLDSKIAPRELANDENNLSKEQYSGIRDELFSTLHTLGASEALANLREQIKSDNAVLRSCHALVHELGHEAYETYRDFAVALKYQDEICNSGYLHGVIESHFSKSGDIFSTMMSVCDAYPLGKYLSWECFHGVGHGVMYYTANDLPKSVALCEEYDLAFSRTTCINGVFMENFSTEQKDHTSIHLDPDNPFYPCSDQKSEHQADCYLYAPTYFLTLHKNDYLGALSWCKGAGAFMDECAHGVGAQAIKENINDPLSVEAICMGGEQDQREPCIDGLVGLYINHFGSLNEARGLCPQLKEINRSRCFESIDASSYLF